jgi:hypothetical protein
VEAATKKVRGPVLDRSRPKTAVVVASYLRRKILTG